MPKKFNLAVRQAAEKHHLFMYQIAQIMDISESSLVKKMRHEWSQEEQERVIKLIEDSLRDEHAEND